MAAPNPRLGMDEPKPAGMRSPGLSAMGLSKKKTSSGLWDRVPQVKLRCEHPQGSPTELCRFSIWDFVVLLPGRVLCIPKTKWPSASLGFSCLPNLVGDPD